MSFDMTEQITINVLGIAPYESMKNAMLRMAETYPQIHLDAYVGNLEEGVEIVQRHLNDNFDAIISRGGTVHLIRQITEIPVIEIALSSYDILRTMKLIDKYPDHYAIIGFPNITTNTRLVGDILQYNIETITIQNQSEVMPALQQLKDSGINMVLGDMITTQAARQLGMNAVLLTSGNESINNAFQQTITLFSSYSKLRERNRVLESAMSASEEHTVIYDEAQNVVYSTLRNNDVEGITAFLKQSIPSVLQNRVYRSFHLEKEEMYSISGSLCVQKSHHYCIFHLTAAKVPQISSKYGIRFTNQHDAQQQYFGSFYGISGSINLNHINDELEQVGSSGFPVMIYGEEGTGKEPIALFLYLCSPRCQEPMTIIDCQLLNEKSWEFLTNHYNSPLNNRNTTIYFHYVDALSEAQGQQLLSILLDTQVGARNRLIFSSNQSSTDNTKPFLHELIDSLACISVNLLPLREQKDKIPALCSLYLASLNPEIGKSIIGFNNSALSLMSEYNWPGNYTQLKRVVNSLCVTTTTSYISASSVQNALIQESRAYPAQKNEKSPAKTPNSSLNLNRTLNEISKDVIQQVVNQNGGNQSAAARRLGISRTTLWRYLNEHK